jgi:flagellar hook-associated protein FlgK
MDISFSAPLSGIQKAEDRVDLAARRIASLPAQVDNPEQGDRVDLSTELVALLQSRHAVQANVKVLQTADEISQTLIHATDLHRR